VNKIVPSAYLPAFHLMSVLVPINKCAGFALKVPSLMHILSRTVNCLKGFSELGGHSTRMVGSGNILFGGSSEIEIVHDMKWF